MREHPRVTLQEAKATAPPTPPTAKLTAATPTDANLTRTPRLAGRLSIRRCQRPECGKRVRYDDDRFCSVAHEIADLRDNIRERRVKQEARRLQKAKDLKAKAEAYVASLSPKALHRKLAALDN